MVLGGEALPRGGRGGGRGGRGGRRCSITSPVSLVMKMPFGHQARNRWSLCCCSWKYWSQGSWKFDEHQHHICHYSKHKPSSSLTKWSIATRYGKVAILLLLLNTLKAEICIISWSATRYGRGGGGGGGSLFNIAKPTPPGWLQSARQPKSEVCIWGIYKCNVRFHPPCLCLILWISFQAVKLVLERVQRVWSGTHFGTNLHKKRTSGVVCNTGSGGCTKSFGLGLKEGFLLGSKYGHGVRLSHYSVYHRCWSFWYPSSS